MYYFCRSPMYFSIWSGWTPSAVTLNRLWSWITETWKLTLANTVFNSKLYAGEQFCRLRITCIKRNKFEGKITYNNISFSNKWSGASGRTVSGLDGESEVRSTFSALIKLDQYNRFESWLGNDQKSQKGRPISITKSKWVYLICRVVAPLWTLLRSPVCSSIRKYRPSVESGSIR